MAGGGDRFAQMAAQRDAMTQKLIDSLDKLTSTVSSGQGVGGGGGGGGGVLGAGGPQASSAGASFWQTGKSSVAGSSLMQSFLSAGGASSTATSVLSGFAAGPLAGGLNAAAVIGGEALAARHREAQAIGQARIDALAGAPLFESDEGIASRQAFAEREARLRNRQGTFSKGMNQVLDLVLGSNAQERYNENTEAQIREEVRRPLAREEFIERGLERRTESFFAPLTNAGARPNEDQIRQVMEMNRRAVETTWLVHADVQALASKMAAARPGSQSAQNAR